MNNIMYMNILLILVSMSFLYFKSWSTTSKIRIYSLICVFIIFLIESKSYQREVGTTGMSVLYFVILVLPIMHFMKGLGDHDK